jgi:uncharacterized protein
MCKGNNVRGFLILLTLVVSWSFDAAQGAEPIRVLLLDGQNNHVRWPKTSYMMKKYLEETGRFQVDVYRTKYVWNGGDLQKEFPLDDGREHVDVNDPKPEAGYRPQFENYQVVLSNLGWKAASWPKATEEAFEKYMASGGGFVVVHAADNSFGEWTEYNKMIGLGGWGGRSEKTGPFVYLNDKGETIRDMTPGSGGSHGPQHEFEVIIRNPEHPITRGLPRHFLHAKDELYDRLRGPGENMDILATAYASNDQKGSGRHEPMAVTITYGKGRVFHTPLGDNDGAMECVGFITLLVRGTEWAATGDVAAKEIPTDFPTPDQTSTRPFKK